MNNNVIIWDLETVPDIKGFASANDLVGRDNRLLVIQGGAGARSAMRSRSSAVRRRAASAAVAGSIARIVSHNSRKVTSCRIIARLI